MLLIQAHVVDEHLESEMCCIMPTLSEASVTLPCLGATVHSHLQTCAMMPLLLWMSIAEATQVMHMAIHTIGQTYYNCRATL